MSTTKPIMNIILPYCGEATGINQNEWLELCKTQKPSQLETRLVIIYATTCDLEKFRLFTQRAKDVFTYVSLIPKYKPSPTNTAQARTFFSYCFMSSWPHFWQFGAGVYIHPEWNPKENYWADNFIATMRVNQKQGIALGVMHEAAGSDLYGCLGYGADFFNTFNNYKNFVNNADLHERLTWEFRRFGHHASANTCPFTKIGSDDSDLVDPFAKIPDEPTVEATPEAELLVPIVRDEKSEEELKAYLRETAIVKSGASDIFDEKPDVPVAPAKKAAKKAAKKSVSKKAAKRRTKSQIEASQLPNK